MIEKRFDAHLYSLNADQLKKIARIWGGNNKTKKDSAIAIIKEGLESPKMVKSMLASLQPHELNALALVKQANNSIKSRLLALSLRATGATLTLPKPSAMPYYYNTSEDDLLIQELINRGLFLMQVSSSPYSYGFDYNDAIVFSDERLLAHVGVPTYIPFELKSIASESPSICRRSSAIILDMIGILQAIESMGGLQLTKSNVVRVSSMRQFKRLMDWKKDYLELDGLKFPNPDQAFVQALQATGMLKLDGYETLVLEKSIDDFSTQPYQEQVKKLMTGFTETLNWSEDGNSQSPKHYVNGRTALLTALKALPTDASGFFALHDFSEAFFNRIGLYFSVMGKVGLIQSSYYRQNTEQMAQARAEQLAKAHEIWLNQTYPWIEKIFSTWLYFLGIVELQLAEGKPIGFRLTDLGRTVFHPELAELDTATLPPSPAKKTESAWVVQPNFDIVVYLDRAMPEQLIFLERHAEKVQVQQYVAQYHLTRESVYQALERGSNLNELISELQAGAGVELPQNILVDLREWGALRENITIHRLASLVEFPNQSARETAIKTKLKGTPIGERFLLLSSKRPKSLETERIDYCMPLPRCIAINESGYIKVTHAITDLLLTEQLNKWAEGESSHMWKLTEASVSAAIKAKARINELFNLLDERLTVRRLPRFLEIVLQSWGRKKFEVELATVTVLQCPDSEVFNAISSSKKLKPYLKGTLAPNLLLVDSENVAALREQLDWAKINIIEEIRPKGDIHHG